MNRRYLPVNGPPVDQNASEKFTEYIPLESLIIKDNLRIA